MYSFIGKATAGVGGAASLEITGIPSNVNSLSIFFSALSDGFNFYTLRALHSGGETGMAQFATAYDSVNGTTGDTSSIFRRLPNNSGQANTFYAGQWDLLNIQGPNRKQGIGTVGFLDESRSPSNQEESFGYANIEAATNNPITGIKVTLSAGVLLENSELTIYGYTD